jgi:hypothetical protein
MPRLSRRNVRKGGKRRRRSGGMDPSSTSSSLPPPPVADLQRQQAAPLGQQPAAQSMHDLGQDKCTQQQKALDDCRKGIAAPSGLTGMMSGMFGLKPYTKGGRKSRRGGRKSRRGGRKSRKGARKSRRRRGGKSNWVTAVK